MKLTSSADSAGLVEDIDFLCETNSTSYPLADKIRNINRWYYRAVIDILKSSGRVQFDDTNLNSLPYLDFDLVDGQKDYSNPADLLKFHALEVKDLNGKYYRLKEIDFQSDLKETISSYNDTDGVPLYYDMGEGSYELYPAPQEGKVTLTGGGRIHLSREVDIFTTDDTTQEPGFAEPFHRILSLGASHDWLFVHDPTKAVNVYGQLEQLRGEMREFYSDKNRDVKKKIRPAHNIHDYL
jgi:hypothetical protein